MEYGPDRFSMPMVGRGVWIGRSVESSFKANLETTCLLCRVRELITEALWVTSE